MTEKGSDLAASAAEVELAAELRRRRVAANLSQTELATKVAFSRPYICRGEKPGGLISAEAVKLIDIAVGADGELIELHERATRARKARRRRIGEGRPTKEAARVDGSRGPATGAHPSATAADTSVSLLAHLGAGIDPLTIEDVERRVDALANRYYGLSPLDFQREIDALRQRASEFLAAPGSSSQRKRVLVVLAALTGMLAESLFAVGGRTDVHCSAALALAMEAGNGALAGWIRSTQAQIALHTGNPSGAIQYAQSGLKAPRGSAGAVRSATYLARAHARVGDSRSARRCWWAAEQAWNDFDGKSGDSVFSLSPDYLACCELTVLAGIGEATPARRLLDSEKASATPTVGRAIREIDAGLIRILDGEIDEAVSAAQRALSIASTRWTTPLKDRFNGLFDALSSHGSADLTELHRSRGWTSV